MTLINGPGRGGGGVCGATPLYKLLYRIKTSRMSANKIFMFLIRPPLAEMLKGKTCIVVLWKKRKEEDRKKINTLLISYIWSENFVVCNLRYLELVDKLLRL